MLERVISGLRAFEKYAVRLPDEYIHSKIAGAAEWVEHRSGISRNKQAIALSVGGGAYAGIVGAFVPALKTFYQQSVDGLSLAYKSFSEGFRQVLSEEGIPYLKNTLMGRLHIELNSLRYAPLVITSVVDSIQLHLKKNNQSNGAITTNPPHNIQDLEIHSHTSLGGVTRPYLLAGSIFAIAYGLKRGNQTLVNYGVSMLPLAISLYVRDDKSGGFLQMVKARRKSRDRSQAPEGLALQPERVKVSKSHKI